MPIWPFRRTRANEDAERLLLAVTQASRQPALYGPGRAPDSLEGRFELMTLNGALALIRLQAEPALAPLAQAFADQLFRQFDAGLREAGVGDTSVPKRMHKMAASFYGRLQAYSAALAAEDAGALTAAVGRNLWGDEEHPFAGPLAAHMAATARSQASHPYQALFEPAGWPVWSQT